MVVTVNLAKGEWWVPQGFMLEPVFNIFFNDLVRHAGRRQSMAQNYRAEKPARNIREI